jgi:subtilisin family serine protease
MSSFLSVLVVSGASVPVQEKSTQAKDDSVPTEGSPYGEQQALFDRLNVEEAWKITKGDPSILVGVDDNGFDFFHPDLKGQLAPGYYYSGGYHTEFFEGIAHGTMMAGIIVAKDDKTGMVGLAPHCRVLTASQGMLEHKLVQMQKKFFDEHPKAGMKEFQKEMMKHQDVLAEFAKEWVAYQYSGTAEAIRYLVDRGVKVINYSGALKKSFSPTAEIWNQLEEAFAYAASKGVVIVLSAGNNAAEWEDYPGSSDSVIIAGAAMLDDTRWDTEVEFKGMKVKQGSNFGSRLTVMAPVERILTCQPHDERVYQTSDSPMGPTKLKFKGPHEIVPHGATSSAAPIVSALVALIFSVNPKLDAKSVIEIVKRGCDDIGEEGYDIHTGYGRVNFGRSVKLARAWNGSASLKPIREISDPPDAIK